MNFTQNMDDEYEKLIRRMNPPRVVIDNESSENATIIQVDSANRQGILLEVVQILTDLNLIITKAYICSDGSWFMDVFNVTDQDGNKITQEEVLDYIKKTLGPDSNDFSSSTTKSIGVKMSTDYTVIEVIGSDRPGLLSEMSAVLTHLKCNVVNAEVWTHNTRAAAVIHVTDEETGAAISDMDRLGTIKKLLCNVLNGSNKAREAKTFVSEEITHIDRRLHQMMFDDRDYERIDEGGSHNERPSVNVVNWYDKDYSVVNIRCKDRPKLLFDVICTLTDMQYVVFHGNVDAEGPEAHLEYWIRHVDGSPVKSEAERERIIHCLEAAIERRVSEGLKLELCTTDRVGLLSDVTRIFRENSLAVTRAEVSTRGGKAVNTFYVRDASGYHVDAKIIDSIRDSIGQTILKVKGCPKDLNQTSQESPTRFLFGGLFKTRSFCNFGLVRSYS